MEEISPRNIHVKSEDGSEEDEYGSTHDEDDESDSKYDEDDMECEEDGPRSSNDDLEFDLVLESDENIQEGTKINRSDSECGE